MTAIEIWKLSKNGIEGEVDQVQPDVLFKNLDEASTTLPVGVYTTFRTYHHNKVLDFDSHIDRLEKSALLTGSKIHINRLVVRKTIRNLIQNYQADEMRIRLNVNIAPNGDHDIYIILAELIQNQYNDGNFGVKVLTRRMARKNPEAKVSNFIIETQDLRLHFPEEINEILMVSEDGLILEGLSSNFFAVKDNQVWTAEGLVLPGITRSFVIYILQEEDIPIKLSGYPNENIIHLEEAFITSTSRGVLPVLQIDDLIIADGRPGKITKRLADLYNKKVANLVQPI
jgi:branched-chain amino acid aminotransferase